MQLKEYIRRYRTDHGGMSQRAFAQKCGLSNGYISMIEKGINPSTGEEPVLTTNSISKLASGMDMSVHALVNAVEDIKIDIGFFAQPPETTESDIVEKNEKTLMGELAETYKLTTLECEVIQAFLDMDPDQQKVFLEMARALKK